MATPAPLPVPDPEARSGFVALAGRPNAGKSTLVNRLVGGKVAITSDKPQTTRRAVRGVLTRGHAQTVVVDLPGVQRPRDALTTRMQRRVERELADADAALLVLNGREGVGPGDRFLADLLRRAGTTTVVALNQIDRIDRDRTIKGLVAAADLGVGEDVFPISAHTGRGVPELLDHLEGLLPRGPFLFPTDERTDQPEHVLLAELVREQVLRRTFQEVPHAVEVQVAEVERPGDDLHVVTAAVWVETESQKGILVGKGGTMVRSVGTAARKEIERELGTRVHLDLQVRVRRDWRSDERALEQLEIE